jgi:hypothetical protein
LIDAIQTLDGYNAAPMSRALLLSCSRRKDLSDRLVPALDRYDGPLFRVLRRYLSGQATDPPRTWVVSAEFGLIPGAELVPCYDHVMTADRAEDLRPGVVERFAREISTSRPDQLFVSVGMTYEDALVGCWGTLDPSVVVRFATGSIGGRASQLHTWLHGHTRQDDLAQKLEKAKGESTILGVTIRCSPEDILEIARAGLRERAAAAKRFQTWFVPVGSDRVAPKWLVSELSGIPVSKFRTADALRVLSCLGIETKKNTL